MSTGTKGLQSAATQPSPWYLRYLLVIGFLVMLVSMMDRYVVSILMEQIKADLQLTDTQLGWLVGPAFVIVHVVFQLPLARLADFTNRRNMIAIAMSLWSLFTVAAGFAKSFPLLLLSRMGVGITEAGCSPPLASLLSDYFGAERRGRAMSIFTLGSVAGIGAGMLLGGIVGQAYGWRTALIVAGVPGVVLAVVFFLTVREPPRGLSDGVDPSDVSARPPLSTVLKTLFGKPSFVWLIIGASFLNVVALGRGVWEPVFLMRIYDLDQATAGITYFLISPVPAMLGAVLGGLLTDHLVKRDQRWCLWLPAVAMLALFPLTAGFLLWPVSSTIVGLGLPIGFLFSIVGSIVSGMASPATIATGQNLSPPAMRAMTHALWTMASNLVGMGLGPLMVGILSDHLATSLGEESIRYAMLIVTGLAILSAIAFYFGARRVREDLV